MMTEAEYLDHDKGFNTPNNSWMFMTKYDAEDPNITLNDGDSSWGSQMMIEITTSNGYAHGAGTVKRIDAHLLETIPQTDWRRKCFIDPELDELVAEAQTVEELNQDRLRLPFRRLVLPGDDHLHRTGFGLGRLRRPVAQVPPGRRRRGPQQRAVRRIRRSGSPDARRGDEAHRGRSGRHAGRGTRQDAARGLRQDAPTRSTRTTTCNRSATTSGGSAASSSGAKALRRSTSSASKRASRAATPARTTRKAIAGTRTACPTG